MSRIAVTGGAGFIGSHLAEGLTALGHQVLVVDNLSTGQRVNVPADAEFVCLDILDDRFVETIRRFRPEAVYHHAAQVSVGHSLRDPLRDARVNILGTLNVLEASVRCGARKLVYASSAAVYGMPETEKIIESHPARPLSYYGISKHTPEHYLEAYARLHGLDYTILRYSNVFGSRQNSNGEGGVVSIFADKLLSGARPVIFGNGQQTRDFIHVRDIVSANAAALERGGGRTMNVSRGASTSVNSLLQLMCRLSGRPFNPVYEPARPGDIEHSLLDNEQAVRELGWSPRITLEDGLQETLDDCARRLERSFGGTVSG